MAAFNKFNNFVLDLASALSQMQTGTAQVYKVYLTNTAPVATNTVYNTPADLSTANGYTAGGVSVGTITGSQTSGTFKFIGGTDPSWTASGGSIGPFQYAVLYNFDRLQAADWLVGLRHASRSPTAIPSRSISTRSTAS
jgi:hypothetical protein